MIGPYAASIRQQRPCGKIINKYLSLTCVAIINPATGRFKISEVPFSNLEEARKGNIQYIDKSSESIGQIFNNMRLFRNPLPQKFVFGNGSKFK